VSLSPEGDDDGTVQAETTRKRRETALKLFTSTTNAADDDGTVHATQNPRP